MIKRVIIRYKTNKSLLPDRDEVDNWWKEYFLESLDVGEEKHQDSQQLQHHGNEHQRQLGVQDITVKEVNYNTNRIRKISSGADGLKLKWKEKLSSRRGLE